MKYLIEIAVGPVQEFIASARKLRDLWSGSTLLSELSKCVAKSMLSQGCYLIFPAPANASDLEFRSELVVANKILAEYEGDNPREVVEKAKKSWKDLLIQISEETLRAIESNSCYRTMNVNVELFRAQIADFGEFFAAWVPVNQDDYGASRHEVEKLLAGRKNLREFYAPMWNGFGIPKNSLDGMRETVIGNKSACISGLLKRNEKLDAIGLVKRFWPLKNKKFVKKFDDLADIASASWFNRIESNPEAKKLYKQFESLFEDGENFPTDAIYEESTNQNVWLEYGCRNSLDASALLRKLCRNDMAASPQKYSCVLLGDGDNMGAAIDKIKTKDGFQNFTKELSLYADKVKNIVKENNGCLIYAGGDDVMAFVPMGTALKCADELRLAFAETMAPICKSQGITTLPTLSVGMAIVHHSEPLSNVLDYARRAEKIAKNIDGKNALAISQNKRSGAPIVVSGKWETQGNLPGLVKRMQDMIAQYTSDSEDSTLPFRLGYQLREAYIEAGDKLEYKVDGGKLVPMNAQSALVQRIFSQKKNASDEMNRLLIGRTSIRKLSDELVVARQIVGVGLDV